MSKMFSNIYDQIIFNSKWVGDCLESTYKVKSKRKSPQATFRGKCVGVHRASWEYHNGKIPNGLYVCHHCDNPKCFRIDHLFLGTPKDNVQDMIKKKRDNNFGRRKYSQHLVKKAVILRREGMKYREISEILGVNFSACCAFILRNINKI